MALNFFGLRAPVHAGRTASPHGLLFLAAGGALLATLAVGAGTARSQVFPGFPVESHWPYGPASVVEAQTVNGQDLIFYGEGTVFRLADVTDRENPVVISEVPTGYAVRHIDITDDGSLAAVSDGRSWVTLIDLSETSAPIISGRYEQADGQGPRGLAFASNDLLIAAISPAGVWALDISVPSDITVAGSYFEPGTNQVFDLEVLGTLAVVADDMDGVSLVDFSDLGNIRLIDRDATGGRAVHITLDGNRAYAAGFGDGVSVFDIDSSGATPALVPVGELNTSGFPGGSAVIRRIEMTSNGTAVLADSGLSNGLVFADISNLSSPVIIGNDRGGRIDAATIGSSAVSIKLDFFQPSEIEFFEPASEPEASASIPHASNSVNLSLSDSGLVVAQAEAGVLLLDSPGSGRALSSQLIEVPGESVRDAIRIGDTLVVISSGTAINLIDMTNPAQPVIEPPYGLGAGATTFDAHPVAGTSWVAVTAGSLGVQIIDVADPTMPTLIDSWEPTTGFISRVFVQGDQLIAAGNTSAWILSLDRTLQTLTEVSSFATSQQIDDVHIEGDLAFLAATINGLEIWDIANPASPAYITAYNPFPITAHGVAVQGQTAYIAADTFYGLIAVDISNPQQPELIDRFDSPGNARKVVVGDDILAMADFDMGVWVWSDASTDALFQDRFEQIQRTP